MQENKHKHSIEHACLPSLQVQCYGAGVEPKGVRAGQPAPFTVDATEAGEALLECSVTDPSGTSPTPLV